jgi:hypothetical protein
VRAYRWLLWAVVVTAIAALAYEFFSTGLLARPTWFPHGQRRFLVYGAAFGIAAAAFFFAARKYFVTTVALATIFFTMYAVGPVAVLAVALLVFSCTVLGRALFGREEWSLSFLAGLGIWALAVALLARVPMHYAPVYAGAACAVLVLRRSDSRGLLEEAVGALRRVSEPDASTYWGEALLAFVILAHWFVVLKPEVSADGLSMHLAIAADFSAHHLFTFDFRQFIWALMPMGADYCYAIAHVMGGEYAARLLNFVMLLSITELIYRQASVWLSPAVASLAAAVFVSGSMVQLVTGSMLVENFIAAMALGSAVALWRFHDEPSGRRLLLSSFLLGCAVGWKIGAVTIAVTVLAYLITTAIRRRRLLRARPAWIALAAVGVFVGPASLPYAKAYVQSGNPLFPFANNIFHSPYIDVDLVDERFREPLTWLTPAQITFHTSRYFEGDDGSFGFQYFFFLPLFAALFLQMRSMRERSALLIGMVAAILIARGQPNARYLYPVLPFLTIASAAALARLRSIDPLLFRICVGALLAITALNLRFLPASNWYHRDFFLRPLFAERGRTEYVEGSAPVRLAIDFVNNRGGNVMMTEESEIAGIRAKVYSNHWHNYAFHKQVQSCFRASDFHRLAAEHRIEHFIAPISPDPIVVESARGMSEFLMLCGEPELRVRKYVVLRTRADCAQRIDELETTRQSELLAPGKYDDMDRRLPYSSFWYASSDFNGASADSLTYSNQPGAQLRIRFNGHSITYGFTKAFNRGMAEVQLDNGSKEVVDMYSPSLQWRAEKKLVAATTGPHEFTIRILPTKNPASKDFFVDVDWIAIAE